MKVGAEPNCWSSQYPRIEKEEGRNGDHKSPHAYHEDRRVVRSVLHMMAYDADDVAVLSLFLVLLSEDARL